MKIVFSPHIDDAFLSLGGSIEKWRKAGEDVKIVNIFTLSNYTKEGLGEKDEVTKQRKEEEVEVQKKTGIEVDFLDYPEALLRGYSLQKGTFFYPCKIKKEVEKKYFPEIEKEISRYFSKENICYFPLGVGDHVDHVLIREIGEKFAREKEIIFYEDIPYVGWFDLPQKFIKKMKLFPSVEEIDINQKIKIVKSYETQIEQEWLDVLKNHAISVGGERVWRF